MPFFQGICMDMKVCGYVHTYTSRIPALYPKYQFCDVLHKVAAGAELTILDILEIYRIGI